MTMYSMWQIFLQFAIAGNHSLLHIYTIFRRLGSFARYITCVRLEQCRHCLYIKLFRTSCTYVIAYSLQDSFQFL